MSVPMTPGFLSAQAPGALTQGDCAYPELLTELLAMEGDPALDADLALTRAVEIEKAAADDLPLRQHARLLQAAAWRVKGDAPGAASIVSEITGWAAEVGDLPLLGRAHRLMASIYDHLGDAAGCLEHSVRAAELLAENATPRVRADVLLVLAYAFLQIGSFDAARDRYEQAEQVAGDCDDVPGRMSALNSLAYCEYRAGDPVRAAVAVGRLQQLAADESWELRPHELDTVARVQISLGRYGEAQAAALACVSAHTASGSDDPDGLALFLLTLAAASRHTGDLADAQDALDRSIMLCEERDLAGIRTQLLQEQAELHAARGDYVSAFEMHKAFHAAGEELLSRQREAQARTRQAMFEISEARREADRFREQARRDALTGLHNRRYVNEHLPELIDRALADGSPLVVGLVDVDHFKGVNDTLSHEVGDKVLVELATMLTAAVPGASADGTGFAARVGGEEFLVVLAAMSPAEAIYRLEDLRRAVAQRDWSPITGALPVTVSIGITGAKDDDTQSSVLSRADQSLYSAKRDGRNRAHFDPLMNLIDRRARRSLS